MRSFNFKKFIAAAMAVFVLLSSIALPVYATIDEEKSNLSDLQNKKSNAQRILDKLEKEKNDTAAYVDKLDGEVTEISLALYKTEQKLVAVNKKIDRNETKLKKAKESINDQYASMKLRIQFMYENGNQQMISLILNSKSIGDFLNKAEYISQISTYDRNMLKKMRQTKKTIENTQAELKEQKSTLTALKKDQEQKKEDVETLYEAKSAELARYDSKISGQQNVLDELDISIGNQQSVIDEMERVEAERKAAAEAEKKRQEELEKRQESDQKETEKTSPSRDSKEKDKNKNKNKNKDTDRNKDKESDADSDADDGESGASSGGFIWPLPGYTKVSSGYGYRADPFSGRTTYHSGIDLPAPAGTKVIAAASGEVAWANRNATAGNWIGIDHGNGIYTVYMHMSALLVSAGQKVSSGQTIGLVGTTGSSTGNHLHFSVRKNGVYTNPFNYVNP